MPPIDCQRLLRLVWEGEAETVLYRLTSTYLITAVWPSGYIAACYAHDTHRGYGSILAHVLFKYYNSNKGKHWNPLESIGMCWNPLEFPFKWIPMETIPGGSRIPTDSTGFRWILLEIPWNGKPKWLRLQPNGFCQNSMKFQHSAQNPADSARTHGGE